MDTRCEFKQFERIKFSGHTPAQCAESLHAEAAVGGLQTGQPKESFLPFANRLFSEDPGGRKNGVNLACENY